MMGGLLSQLMVALPLTVALAVLADAFAAPRGPGLAGGRGAGGLAVLLLAALSGFGLLLALTGAPLVAAAGVGILAAALSLISNIKRLVLGEPLVFSDFALLGAVFQHPQFYLSALRPWQVAVLAGGLGGLGVTLVLLSNAALAPRLAGACLALGAGTTLALALSRRVRAGFAAVPDPEADVARLGLVPCLLAYWRAWRGSPDPQPCDAAPITGNSRQLVVIVQCESFTDPVEMFDDPALALPGLERARAQAWQAGRLAVSGFGAYTMRTEYGVLLGLPEERLGMRRFDPFLTAAREASWALPNRLDHGAWNRWFVHPHDLRFYGRDRIMPASGFATLVGEECFAPPAPGEGRYVTDAAITDRILALAQDGARAGLIYAVTIENHGPWPAEQGEEARLIGPYLRLLARSDAMLTRLLDELPRLGRPVTLCFFGDHRPSIPGASEPGAERHTPYVLLRFAADGTPIAGSGEVSDLAPAALHHAILDAIRLGEAEG
jgi:phosphoglycerol transferase MdoB-like AlkP superfamily enzyme